jgi:hypothetical protein
MEISGIASLIRENILKSYPESYKFAGKEDITGCLDPSPG